ncbi:translation initiation factor eIF-2A [Hesseltinella vesiculosa]|uniref:Eukaryotic translation initiation factor 2A n=1 Tax=Hesseltinella vesiculosa TaxID=101127 RepID=A0A1X2GQY4_9FUNG|nr:translation initiation factor eIF-2A [Hesseltinella vesiculosa]
MSSHLTQFSYRSQKDLTVWSGYPEYKPIKEFEKPEITTRIFKYSKYGQVYAYGTAESVKVFDTDTLKQRCVINHPNVLDLWFSPQGNYLATWERYTKLEDGTGCKNLFIWNTKTGEEIASFSQKAQNNWNVQWTDDEKYCARLVTGEVQFWESRNVGKSVWSRLQLEGVNFFSLSPGKNPAVAVFIPERKGSPAIVRLYSIPSFASPVSNKTFFKADNVQMFWNDLGTNLLVLTQTEVDKTGRSYYGETNLYYLAVAGNFDCRVPLDKEGAVHDVAWSPDSKEFVVVYGSMPAQATLFDHRAKAIFSFGVSPRNFVRFNSQGTFLCIAGFGNLNGTIDLWDRRKLAKVNTFAAPNASHCEWSPCGRYLMTATLTPRLRVDNGFKMWHYTGTLIYEESVEELFQIGWRPEPASNFPALRSGSPTPQPIKVLPSNKPKAPVSGGAYRPPHLRGSAAPTSLAEREAMLSRGQSPASARRHVPGASTKNAKPSSNGKPNSKPSTPPPAANNASKVLTQLSPEEKQKKIRNLEKKLRQINELKEKQMHGATLEPAQLQKLTSEATVLRDLASLR